MESKYMKNAFCMHSVLKLLLLPGTERAAVLCICFSNIGLVYD